MTTITQRVLCSNKTVSISNSAVPHMAYNVCKSEDSPLGGLQIKYNSSVLPRALEQLTFSPLLFFYV